VTPPDGKAPDGKAPDGKAPDGKAPDGKAVDDARRACETVSLMANLSTVIVIS
jgi:hypothetical protein